MARATSDRDWRRVLRRVPWFLNVGVAPFACCAWEVWWDPLEVCGGIPLEEWWRERVLEQVCTLLFGVVYLFGDIIYYVSVQVGTWRRRGCIK